MASLREVIESPLEQGKDERVPYQLTTTPWGGTPSSVTVTLWLVSADGSLSDVSSTCLTGSSSVSGDVLTTPVVYSLTADSTYRLEMKFTTGSKIYEPYLIIWAKT